MLVFAGCATKTGAVAKPDEREILRNRVREFWDLQININLKNADRIYQYEVPAFREKFSLIEYVNRFKVIKYLEADIKQVEVEGVKGKVTVASTYQVPFPHIANKKLTSTEVENWIRLEGTWYHIPKAFQMPE